MATMSEAKNIKENFINSGNAGTFPGSTKLNVSNMVVGGQLGYSIKPGYLDAATPLVLAPAVLYVCHTPFMWDHMGEAGQILAQMVKALMETHAKSVSGIDIGYTMQYQQTIVGKDGQNLDAPTVLQRTNVNPSFTWSEVTGNVVFGVNQAWLWDMCDPDTQIAFSRVGEADIDQLPYTFSSYSASFIAIQYDMRMNTAGILDAIYITNVCPQGTNEYGIKREIGQATVPERSITYTGLALHNAGVYTLAQTISNSIKYRSKVGATWGNSTIGVPYGDGSTKLGDNVDANSNVGIQREATTTELSGDAVTKTPEQSK